MYTNKKTLLLSVLFCGFGLCAQNIKNPVLPGVADAGAMKYNGKYYVGGVFTNGDFYVSSDLVNWSTPVHAITMDNDWTRGSGAGNDQIHANDMIYLNGDFHLYWSVNYWGKDKHAVHIVHAQSDSVTGPYVEPEKTTWMDNRIDPQVFRDDDGQLYMYMVRFTDGNTIWGRKMMNPARFAGPPVCQFASLPDTWETMDNRVAEGPWVMKYRNRYYMMYNANHTSTQWGNYQFGVAEAESPLTFQNGSKYSYPVMASNQFELEEKYTDILRYGQSYEPLFDYTDTKPSGDWTQAAYTLSGWKKGETGFASQATEGSTTRHQGTEWQTPALWLRKTFRLTDTAGNLAMRVAHDGDTKIYLNGQLIYDKRGADYCMVNLNDKQLPELQKGSNNLLAIETNKGRSNFFDIALFDLKETKADDIYQTPGQPNILRGPNGFEWWLIYMANRNHEHRSQYINRVQFFDKTLFTGDITGPNTAGYHPEPSMPTYGDTFDDSHAIQQAGTFRPAGQWNVDGGELRHPGNVSSYGILDKLPSATTYLFEAGVNASGNAGIIIWQQDANNYVYAGLDAATHNWYLQSHIAGKDRKEVFPLPDDFRFGVYHTFTVEKNADLLKIRLDGIPAPGKSQFSAILPKSATGIPGLFVEKGETAFDGLIYTIGFDDYDDTMPGWKLTGETYRNDANGLTVTTKNKTQAIKGDPLENYEYAFQVSGLTTDGLAGGYPLYIDENNNIKTVFNGKTRTLDVLMIKNGKPTQQKTFPLSQLKTVYPDVKYTDFIEKAYYFDSPVWLDALYLNRHEEGDKNNFTDDMFDKFNIEYAKDGKWQSLTPHGASRIAAHPAYNELPVTTVHVDALRFINKEPEDLQRHIYKIRINEVLKESYNLRAIRKTNKLWLYIDGREICMLEVDYPASQAGLCSENCTPRYNGILYYHTGNK